MPNIEPHELVGELANFDTRIKVTALLGILIAKGIVTEQEFAEVYDNIAKKIEENYSKK